MKRCKFQALVTPNASDEAREKFSPGSHRMVVRAQHSETGQGKVFAALVDAEEEGPFRPGRPEVVVTLRVIGDDMADYLDIGSHFSLWSGSDVGRGVVTGRLFL